jgi:UDP-glucose 4-epimerase
MKVLITGVAGFVGSNLAKWLLTNVPNVEIHGWDDLSGGYIENVPRIAKFYRLDVAELIDKCGSFDYIFHFAAYAAEVLSPFIRNFNYTNNVVGTANMVNAALNGLLKDGGRFVYASSAAVYSPGKPYPLRPPFNEGDLLRPNDPYGVAKMACEHDLRIAGEQHGLDYCILRMHNIYGRQQNIWDRYRNVFGIWTKAILEENTLPAIYGDGEQRRAFTYIDDILPCLWQAAVAKEASRETINLGGSTPISINEAVDIFVQTLEGLRGFCASLYLRTSETRSQGQLVFCREESAVARLQR